MKNRRNYYRILHVQPDAPLEIIRSSYRTLMRQLRMHPDLGGSNLEASLLNEAYETLSNPTLRAAYDRRVLERCIRRGAPAPNSENPAPPSHSCPFCGVRLARKPQAGEICMECGIPLPSEGKADFSPGTRRSISRLKKNGRIAYSCTWPGIPKEAMMIDLSPKGMRFVCGEKLKIGSIIKITGPALRACAVVTNLRAEERNDKTAYTVGASFLSAHFEETRGSFISVSA